MTAIRIRDFGGELPSRSPRLLPDNNAVTCENAQLSEGGLDTYPLPAIISALLGNTEYVYRIPTTSDVSDYALSVYMEFDDADTKVVKAPIPNDSFERFYWAVPGQSPQYNTKARIIDGDPAYVLGMPTSADNMTVTPDGSGVGATEYRAYTFTWVSAYGEEGPPAPAILANGKIDDVWDLTFPAITGPESAQRNITHRNVYRTITGSQGDTNYYLVTTLLFTDLAYADSIPGTEVTANGLIQSTFWVEPPDTLQGLIMMPNGIMAGFTGRDIYFSEPYRPHAWPTQYSVSVEQPIVGLGVTGNTLVVLTNGYPYFMSGIHPSTMTQVKHNDLVPCVEAGTIVSAPDGVYFASTIGLMLAANGTIQLITYQLISKQQWQNDFSPTTLHGIYYKQAYMAMRFDAAAAGFSLNVNNPKIAIERILPPVIVKNVLIDQWTGDPMMIMGSYLYQWDNVTVDGRVVYRWASKEFHLTKPQNLAAMKVYFDDIPANSQSSNVDAWAVASLALLPLDVKGEVKVYADRVLVLTRNLPTLSGDLMRLPDGFKASIWQIQITGRVRVDSIEMASTAKELESV